MYIIKKKRSIPIKTYPFLRPFSIAERNSKVQARAASGTQTRTSRLQCVAGDDRVGAELHLPAATTCHADQTDMQATLLSER